MLAEEIKKIRTSLDDVPVPPILKYDFQSLASNVSTQLLEEFVLRAMRLEHPLPVGYWKKDTRTFTNRQKYVWTPMKIEGWAINEHLMVLTNSHLMLHRGVVDGFALSNKYSFLNNFFLSNEHGFVENFSLHRSEKISQHGLYIDAIQIATPQEDYERNKNAYYHVPLTWETFLDDDAQPTKEFRTGHDKNGTPTIIFGNKSFTQGYYGVQKCSLKSMLAYWIVQREV